MKFSTRHAKAANCARAGALKRNAEPAAVKPEAAQTATAVDRLRDSAHQTAGRAVARARAARELGAPAEGYRAAASELERQAARAETLLFDRAVQVFRAAAAENRLIADALDAIEGEDRS